MTDCPEHACAQSCVSTFQSKDAQDGEGVCGWVKRGGGVTSGPRVFCMPQSMHIVEILWAACAK